ncbi:MAG: HAMP domain-containing sensor histidine kinase [Acidobacteriota bacterium]
MRPGHSLFWTFAGAFLAVVAVAALVQLWVLSALGERLTAEQVASAAQRPAYQVSLDLARRMPPIAIGGVLREAGAADGTFFLVYEQADGKIVLPWRASREVRHRLARWLRTGDDRWQIDDALDEAFGRPRDDDAARRGAGPPRRGAPRPPGPPDLDGGPPGPPRFGPGDRDGRPRPPRGDEGRPPRPGVGDDAPPGRRPGDRRAVREVDRGDLPAPGRLRLLSRLPVVRGDRQIGTVTVVHPLRRGSLSSLGETPALVLFPVALALAAAGGLVLFRLLTRRLERLEELAARIEAGDLAARLPDPGDDEIGRLGGGLNRMAAALEQARAQVDASVEERRRLLADISHELATPLTSIRGYAESLLDYELPLSPEESVSYLESVLDEARRMELLLGDLFELTRLEAGIFTLDREQLDWAALCRHTAARYRPRFEQAGLSLRFASVPEEVWVEADGRRLEQVLENLLTNALRYVPAGGTVEVRLTASQLERGETSATLEVADDGPGFPPEDLPHVFDRFYRGDATSAVPGSGLGLAIVKEIVERHGGCVEAACGTPGAVLRIVLPTASLTEGPIADGE